MSNSSSLEIISYVNDKKLPVIFQKTEDSSNDDPPSQQKMTEEENEKVSMPFGEGENIYMRSLVVSWCWGWCKPSDIVKKDRKDTDPTKKKTIPSQQRLSQHSHLVNKSLVCDRVLNGLYFFVEFVPQEVFE